MENLKLELGRREFIAIGLCVEAVRLTIAENGVFRIEDLQLDHQQLVDLAIELIALSTKLTNIYDEVERNESEESESLTPDDGAIRH